MLQVVLDVIIGHEVSGCVQVVEPLRVYLEELFTLLQLLHLFGLHEGDTAVMRMDTLTG